MNDPTAKSAPTLGSLSSAWMVMKAYPFSAATAGGIPLMPEPGGPPRFIPVFDSREAAIAWAGEGADVEQIKVGNT